MEDNKIQDGRPGFGIIYNDFVDRFGRHLGPNGLAVYMVLVRFANDKGAGAYPSYTTIADRCGMSRRTVVTNIDLLVKIGLVKKEKRSNARGQASNLYTIMDSFSVSAPDALPDSECKTCTHLVQDVHPPSAPDAHDQDTINKTPKKKTQKSAGATLPAAPLPSHDDESPLTEQQQWFQVACAIVGWDYQTLGQKERGQVAQTLGIIRKAGYSLEELKQFLPQVWHKDWRWVKNQSFPTLSQLKTEIGKVRAARVEVPKNFVPPVAPAAVGGKDSVYGNIVKW